MNLSTPIRRKIVAATIKRFPSMGALTLAKKIYREHGDQFSSVESARSAVRYEFGTDGKQNRQQKCRAGGSAIRNPRQAGGTEHLLPDSKAVDLEPLHLNAERILLLSDIHLPYHDRAAVELAVKTGRDQGVDCVCLNGDTADFYTISRWEKDPAKRRLKDEIESIRAFLAYIRERFPKARIVMKKGNHEERWDSYIWLKAPELFDLPSCRMEAIIEADKYGVEVVGDKRFIFAGKLPVLHGHELPNGISSPVNPARGFFMRGMESVIAGHLHRTSEHTEPTMLGRFVTTWSTGCLCHLHPDYAPINKWNLGFATVEVSKGGTFRVDNRRIHEGKVL